MTKGAGFGKGNIGPKKFNGRQRRRPGKDSALVSACYEPVHNQQEQNDKYQKKPLCRAWAFEPRRRRVAWDHDSLDGLSGIGDLRWRKAGFHGACLK